MSSVVVYNTAFFFNVPKSDRMVYTNLSLPILCVSNDSNNLVGYVLFYKAGITLVDMNTQCPTVPTHRLVLGYDEK